MAGKDGGVLHLSTLVTSCFPWAMHRKSNSETELEQVNTISRQYKKPQSLTDLRDMKNRLMDDIPHLHYLTEGGEALQEVVMAIRLAGRCLNSVQNVRAEQELGHAVPEVTLREMEERMDNYTHHLARTGLWACLQHGEGHIHVCGYDQCPKVSWNPRPRHRLHVSKSS